MSMLYTEAPRQRNIFAEIVKFTILAFLIITPFRFFVAQPFIVSGASMEPTFEPHEYLIIDQLSYRFEKPERGDIIIFRYPLDPDTFFIKRVIGLPGETVHIGGGITIESPDGTRHVLDEPYIASDIVYAPKTVTLADDEFYVLGDNRNASSDSRAWGPLHARYIVGKAMMRLFPFNEASIHPGDYTYTE